MTKGTAMHNFFSSFGIPAYASTSVPEEAELPYLTYTPVFDSFSGAPTSITVDLWYRTESEAVPSAKAQEIAEAIGIGGKVLACEDGYIWLYRGTPWCQSLTDAEDPTVKRRYINVTAEFLTTN